MRPCGLAHAAQNPHQVALDQWVPNTVIPIALCSLGGIFILDSYICSLMSRSCLK